MIKPTSQTKLRQLEKNLTKSPGEVVFTAQEDLMQTNYKWRVESYQKFCALSGK